jgi:hypothetical protein
MEQQGKRTNIGWADITASCAYKDYLILGFGNGAMAMVKVNEGRALVDNLHAIDFKFSGEEDHPIDKMRILTMDLP